MDANPAARMQHVVQLLLISSAAVAAALPVPLPPRCRSRRYKLLISQPSVCSHANSFTWIKSSYQQPDTLLRFVSMVEIMVRPRGRELLNVLVLDAAESVPLVCCPSEPHPPNVWTGTCV